MEETIYSKREWWEIVNRKVNIFVIAITIIALLVTIIDILTGQKTLIETLKKAFQQSPAVFVIVVSSFALIDIGIWIYMYRTIRKLYIKPKPDRKNLRRAFRQIFLDSSIANKLWPANENPPIFIIGKDKEDIDRVIKDNLFVNIYSFKWASTSSVAFIANVASQLGHKWAQDDTSRPRRMDILLQSRFPLSCLDIDAFEGLEKGDRSIISVSAGDSNFMSGIIFRDFERVYNCSAPLRFSSRFTAEAMIAETEDYRHVLVEETDPKDERTGMILAANQGKSDALWVVLAGLARPGTEASCILFCHLLSQEKSENKVTTEDSKREPLYEYSRGSESLPCAVSILEDDNKSADAILISPYCRKRFGKSISWPNANVLIVIGGIPRFSDQPIEENQQILTRDASAIIDFVVNYTIWHPTSSIQVLQTEHSNVELSTIKQLNFDNIIIVGNKEQNSLLKEILDDNDFVGLNDMYNRSLEGDKGTGIILVYSRENKRFIIVYGHTGKFRSEITPKPGYLQTAIRGLIRETRKVSLGELNEGIMKYEPAAWWRDRYVTDARSVNTNND